MAGAVEEAVKASVTVVGAAGNEKLDNNEVILYDHPLYYPAAFPNVLGIGSIDDGPACDHFQYGFGIGSDGTRRKYIWSAIPGGYIGYDSGDIVRRSAK